MRINKLLYFGDFLAVPIALAIFVYLAFAAEGGAAALGYGAGLAAGLFVWTLRNIGSIGRFTITPPGYRRCIIATTPTRTS
jgi:hypothetical protein